MKSISLYVDKWYMVGSVNLDGVPYPISLPNGEDRLWLYFFEDVANNNVLYGKRYERPYRDRTTHYIGDIFSLLQDGRSHFVRFDNRPEEIKEIFNASGIFDHLHQAAEVSVDKDIDVYVSFSSDVNHVARKYFLDEMNDHHLIVKESVAWISQLALEECRKRGQFTDEDYYLVMEATNENLHYSVYQFANGMYLRKASDVLYGYGLDIRRRSLIESVVETINRNTHFLRTQEELTQEYMRLDRFADEWLDKVVKSRGNIPVPLSEVALSVAPNNPFPVTVSPKTLDIRTAGLVNEIVRKVEAFIKEIPLTVRDIKGIVFLGNTFTNQQYQDVVNAKFVLNPESLAFYSNNDLSRIVAMYTFIDCNQFSLANKNFELNAEQEAARIRLAQEEEEAAKKAKAEAEALAAENDRLHKAEREYRNAMDNVADFERNHEYEQMLDWATIALTQRPGDELAEEKIQQAQQLIADERAKAKQYNDVMQRVKICMDERRWTDAISQCEVALSYRLDSKEAKRSLEEAKRQLEVSENVKNYLNRADVFIAQQLYDNAEKELKKVKGLDPTNAEASKRLSEIQSIISSRQKKVQALIDALETYSAANRFDEAIQVCERLAEYDAANLRKWTESIERLKYRREQKEAEQLKLSDIKQKIDSSFFNEDWPVLIQCCNEYLLIKEEKTIRDFLVKAQARWESVNKKKAFTEGINQVKALMSDGHWEEAEKELDALQRKYPQEKDSLKELRKRIFNALATPTPINEKEKKRPIGFRTNSGNPPRSDDGNFFDGDDQKKINKPVRHKEKEQDDFFDSPGNKKTNRVKAVSKNENDFNF